MYPQRNGDGIVRRIEGGIGVGTIYPRDEDYLAPVDVILESIIMNPYGG
jgi:D-ornithine 4,5-aminomutase subunit beta